MASEENCDSLRGHSSDEILDIVSLPAVRAGTEFRLGVTITATRRAAISVVNPSDSETASVKIQLRGVNRDDNAALIEIPPLSRISRFLLEIVVPDDFPADPTRWLFRGTATITSNIPIAVGALDFILPDGKLVYVPVARLEN